VVEIVCGNLFEADAEAYVNAVNCKGVMGAGIALEFKNRYPGYFEDYRKVCRKGLLHPGGILPWVKPYDWTLRHNDSRPRYILSFATKGDWRFPSQEHWIGEGLFNLVREIEELGIKSVAMPAVGCGHGGLRWDNVRCMVEFAFRQVPDIRVLLYEPQ
jgi:O-acetyl-ADP-ribose deacetylase (regulator of RNase III)